jgi:HSF-type DNA-binding
MPMSNQESNDTREQVDAVSASDLPPPQQQPTSGESYAPWPLQERGGQVVVANVAPTHGAQQQQQQLAFRNLIGLPTRYSTSSHSTAEAAAASATTSSLDEMYQLLLLRQAANAAAGDALPVVDRRRRLLSVLSLRDTTSIIEQRAATPGVASAAHRNPDAPQQRQSILSASTSLQSRHHGEQLLYPTLRCNCSSTLATRQQGVLQPPLGEGARRHQQQQEQQQQQQQQIPLLQHQQQLLAMRGGFPPLLRRPQNADELLFVARLQQQQQQQHQHQQKHHSFLLLPNPSIHRSTLLPLRQASLPASHLVGLPTTSSSQMRGAGDHDAILQRLLFSRSTTDHEEQHQQQSRLLQDQQDHGQQELRVLLQAEWIHRQQQQQQPQQQQQQQQQQKLLHRLAQQQQQQQILNSQRLNRSMPPLPAEDYIRALQEQQQQHQHESAGGDRAGVWSSIAVAERVRASAGLSQGSHLQSDSLPRHQNSADAFTVANAARSHELSSSALLQLLGHLHGAGSTTTQAPRTTVYASLPSPTADQTLTAAPSSLVAIASGGRGPTPQSREHGQHDDERKPAAVPLLVSAAAAAAAAADLQSDEEEDSPSIVQAKKRKERTTSSRQQGEQQPDQQKDDAEEKDEEFKAFLRTLPNLSRLRRDYDHEAFPAKLHRMLSEMENKGLSHIVSWTESGHAFRVYNPTLFEKEIGPKYFRHQQYASFRRLCSTYGFQRLVR